VLSAHDLAVCTHEAAHSAAALFVGSELVSVSREGAGGQTISVAGSDVADPEGALVMLLVSTYVSGIGCGRDLESAVRLANDTGSSLDSANDRVRQMIVDPAYRWAFRTIEGALASRPTLTGDDVGALLAR
jgi:hypothetical protein